MDERIVKEALSYSLGEELHDAWCKQEIYAFFLRACAEYEKTKNYGEAFQKACFVGDTKRNEVNLDVPYLVGHENLASRCLTDFNVFMRLFHNGIIEIKRFKKTTVSSEEEQELGKNFKEGKENILREFKSLSSDAKCEYLDAARVAIDLVFHRIVSGEILRPEDIERLAGEVHLEWLRRNMWIFEPGVGNPQLAVPYAQLSEEEKAKDRSQIYYAQDRVHAYIEGLVDVSSLCHKYGLSQSSKQF